MKKRYSMFIAVLTAALLSGCAQKGPILVDFNYEAPRGVSPIELPAVVVGVSPFKDDRGKSDSVAGRRFNSLNDEVNDLVVQGTVPDKVTTALKNALTARDITVKNVPAWDLTETGIPADGSNLLISGEIKTLWLESTSSLANTKIKATVELRILAADIAQKKIIRTLNVNSTIERQSVTYSTSVVESTMSEAISAALNQIFNDEELKSRLK